MAKQWRVDKKHAAAGYEPGKKATRKQVVELAEKLGCVVEERSLAGSSMPSEILITAPDGYVFSAVPDVHQLVQCYWNYIAGEKAEAWGAMYSDLRFGPGVEKCQDEACELCMETAIEKASAFFASILHS